LRVSVGSATPNFFTTERVDLLTAIAGALGAHREAHLIAGDFAEMRWSLRRVA